MKNQIIFILVFTVVSFSSNCSIESMDKLLSIDKGNLAYSNLDNNILNNFQSSQGSEGKLYYDKHSKKLKYIEIYVYGEMGRNILKFYFDEENKILFQSIEEHYNQHIYAKGKLEILSKTMHSYPICDEKKSKNLFFGIEEKEYNNTIDLVRKLIKYYKYLLNKSRI